DPDAWPVQPGWRPLLQRFWAAPEGRHLLDFLHQRLADRAVIYPPEPLRALALTAPEDIRVVVLGQDPYHGPGQAEGLAFSVAPGVKLPPSLRNIFLERQRDLGLLPPLHGSLTDRKSTRLNSSHVKISYAVFCLKKKNRKQTKCR